MTKAERLQTGDSQMTQSVEPLRAVPTLSRADSIDTCPHPCSLCYSAMMLVAVHLDAITHKPVRWRVQNSWGLDACIKGYLVMSDEWFTVSPLKHGRAQSSDAMHSQPGQRVPNRCSSFLRSQLPAQAVRFWSGYCFAHL